MPLSELRVLVIGAGPAGATAALQARDLGAAVTLLEAGQVGGTSFNSGPAPVRTLARAARLMRDSDSWARFGLVGSPPVPDISAVLANSQRVATYSHDKKDMAGHLRHHGIELFADLGDVHFIDPWTVEAENRSWSADRIIVAVGGRPGRIPIPGNELGLTYEDIRHLTSLPERVAVVGGADTGCQIASIFQDFGVTVVLFEAGPRLVPANDASVSAELQDAFRSQGIEVHTDTLVQALRQEPNGIAVDFAGGGSTDQRVVDAVFFAVGWPPNTDRLNLAAAGLDAGNRGIGVDEYLHTNVDHIFAAGDVTGQAMLVQTARMEGRVAAYNAVRGLCRRTSYAVVPSASFTDPEYGRVGLTEAEAQSHHDIAVGIARYEDLLRPVADGRPEGFCKLIVDRHTKLILGAHVIGEYSAETVQVVATCIASDMPVDKVGEIQFAFPTFTEAVSMAAQKVCRKLGIGDFPEVWSYLGHDD
jgi:pyruvate/2-oxoglutarate dehydrogenase complex dihydrolipoamide dehydrogenase (E3) component